MKKPILNDEERRLWILNDESLYMEWKRSQLSMIKFIRLNKFFIDMYIFNQLNRPPR